MILNKEYAIKKGKKYYLSDFVDALKLPNDDFICNYDEFKNFLKLLIENNDIDILCVLMNSINYSDFIDAKYILINLVECKIYIIKDLYDLNDLYDLSCIIEHL